jgi:3-oxoacyl-[acyl-carrier protein] reductase
MDLGLTQRNAVVLGSTSGLGLGVARALLEEGANVAISGRDPDKLARATAELDAHAERLLAEPLDITDGDALRAHLDAAAARFGPVEILVTNGGGPPPGGATDVTDEGLDAAFDLTLRSAVRAVQHVLPSMRATKWGRIVGLTSISVRQPIATLTYSNVMRSGLTAWFKTLAGEVAQDGVLVNTVCTGLFRTERLEELFELNAAKNGTSVAAEEARQTASIPTRRLGETHEFGALVAFLCSERCSYLNGVALTVDGGLNTALL